MDFLKGLNDEQRRAVAHGDGPLLILAGAGSGKTRVITHRIAHLIHAGRVPPHAVAAVTFTNKAANEMKERVAALLSGGHTLAGLTVSTFHSFAVRLLRRDGEPLAEVRPGFTRNFTIYDEDDQLAVIKAVYRELGLEEKQFMQCRAALGRISFAKNHNQGPEDLYKAAKDPKSGRLAKVYEEYDGRLRQANALDFDDLLLEAVRLLRRHQATREAYNDRIRYLLIDEYQDTNRSQYDLMRLLSQAHRNVCVVGDEDQSIYSWRGADIRNILEFEKDFPDATVIRLEQNYRSTKNILEAASSVVAHNTQRLGKWLWTAAGAGGKIGVYEASNGLNEADFVSDTIERLLAAEAGARVAILYRTNAQSRPFEEALRRCGRPYHVVGGFSFYQRAEIRDTLAYLKVILSPDDSVSLLRIINTPARGIGKTTVEQIEAHALQHRLSLWNAIGRVLDEGRFSTRAGAALAAFRRLMQGLRAESSALTVDDILRLVLERTGYARMLEQDDAPESESRLENLRELVNAAADAVERGESTAEFLDHAALVSDADSVDEKAQVSLLTLHNAKGLEFPVVFVTGLEERLFPHSRSVNSDTALEEERRLFYVGMTRAQQRLFLTWARQRRRYASGLPESTVASRFLSEVPHQLVEELGEKTSELEGDLWAERYEVGETVRRNVAEFFGARHAVPKSPPPPVPLPRRRPAPNKPQRPGSTIQHPRFGKGTIVRREGEGEHAKITVSFPGHGLKKLMEQYVQDEHEKHNR
ncbi:MAG: UvrD-helicase domain-containing protein [Acidobacteriota bacterium]